MKEYEIWIEGHAATGDIACAKFMGKQEAETFEDACIKKIGHLLDKDSEQPDGYRRRGGRFCVWACCCYDNEIDARKSFG
jgi:hypothetical protein